MYCNEELYGATEELALNAVTIAVTVVAGVEPEATNIVVAVFAGVVLPVTAIIIPLIEKEPVGWIKGAKLALLTVTEAVVAKFPLTIGVEVASENVPETTLATNIVSPPLLK